MKQTSSKSITWLGTAFLAVSPFSATAALVWHSAMDGNADAIVGTNGTAVGTPIATTDRNGTAGGAVSFNGTDAYYTVPAAVSMLPGGTIAFWANVNDINNQRGAVAVGASGGGTTQYFIIQNSNAGGGGGAGNGAWRADVDNGAARLDAFSDNSSVSGVWEHVAVTFSAGGTLRTYINGVLQAEQQDLSAQTNADIVPTNDWLVGAERVGDRFFSGSLDDVRIYDNELSASEVVALVPEPSSALLGLVGLGFLSLRRRR